VAEREAGFPPIGLLTGMQTAMTGDFVPGSSARWCPSPPEPPFPSALSNGVTRDLTLRTFLELGALPGAVPCARLHTRQVLWEWRLTRLSDNAELVVSELVTNAVAASASMTQVSPVRLWLLAGAEQVVIMVWDGSPQPPVPADADGNAENGRGLLLVEAMSERWDWYFPELSGGKVVWALTSAR
jgi:anti-sigma regulatory factor (Ser/Thr protein kinase)